MKRLLTLAALAASLALAACGGSSGSSSSSGSSTPTTKGTTIAVKSIAGVGNVLVDSSGKALYSSDVEADGKVHCTAGCTSFWKPLTASGKPTGPTDAGRLGTVMRPDGTSQVTLDGKLLYTFSEDSPGKVSGNGFSDQFDGRHFTWNAVLAGGKSSGSSGSTPSRNDYGY